MSSIRLALAQVNPSVGDLSGNVEKIIHYTSIAEKSGADIIAFPELSVTGYPPEDLLFKPQFLEENVQAAKEIASYSKNIVLVYGFVDTTLGTYNAAAIAHGGKIVGIYRKVFLPNYGVFDEERYFKSGEECPIFNIAGVSTGINICEDIWYDIGPTGVQRAGGAEVIININGSPFHVGKREDRENMLRYRAKDHGLFVAYVNQVGGQDELVFDGSSLVIDPVGNLVSRAKQFEEDLLICELDLTNLREKRGGDEISFSLEDIDAVGHLSYIQVSDSKTRPEPYNNPSSPNILEPIEEIRQALVIGTRDYVRKTGFSKVLIGLSGGIDSSLVAAIAVEALGKQNVIGVSMPSQFSSEGSLADAQELSNNLGIQLLNIPIEDIFESMQEALSEEFLETPWGVAEENIQSRIRGNLIMALSNKFGWLVLTTGNKSEMAVGYATIYGDMAGGFSVIKDVPKIMVYDLSRHINSREGKDLIPLSVLKKPPSAELRPDQKDSDTLPDYEVLDPILQAYVENDLSFGEIIDMGFDTNTVKDVIVLVDRNEYKRRQSPPGVKITPRNFGRDRRMPVANRYRPF